jgi:hypothetical protein
VADLCCDAVPGVVMLVHDAYWRPIDAAGVGHGAQGSGQVRRSDPDAPD